MHKADKVYNFHHNPMVQIRFANEETLTLKDYVMYSSHS